MGAEMKGYRKLKVGEVIKECDVEDCAGRLLKYHPTSVMIGVSLECYHNPVYRPIPKTSKRKYPKRLKLQEKMLSLVLENWVNPQTQAKNIVKFIQNNYRRRVKGVKFVEDKEKV